MTSDRYWNTKIAKIKAAYDDLRAAVRAGDNEAAQEALDRYEQWADFAFAPQPDLTQAAVAAALEGAADTAMQVADRAGKVGAIHNSMGALQAHDAIRTLITQPQREALQAVINAAKAEARAEDADLLYNAWLGLRVLENIAKVKGLSGAADVTTPLLAEIEAANPEFAPRSALRAKIGAKP